MSNVMIGKDRMLKIRKAMQPWLFIAPAGILLCAVLLIPIINVFYYSFLDNNFVNPNAGFIWFDNYKAILTDSKFIKMLVFTVTFTLGSVLLHVTTGILLAVALNTKINKRALTFFRVLFILPWVFTAAVVAIVWQMMMTPSGVFNAILTGITGTKVVTDWLGNSNLVVFSLLLINAWRGYPHCMISILAGLQNISPTIYEAASVDGATKTRQFFSITLPQLTPVISSVAMLDAIWTMNLFPLIWLTTGGGPDGATESIATWTYRLSFIDFQFGKASALAVIGLLITLCFTFIYTKMQARTDA